MAESQRGQQDAQEHGSAGEAAADLAAELSESARQDGRGAARALHRLRRLPGEGPAAGRSAGVLARRCTAVARQGAGAAGKTFSGTVSWLTGQVLAMGPRLRIRDQAALRAQFPGRSDEEIADLLIERAARAAATVGGATGAWSALPALPAFPAEIAAETLAVTGIEIKLVAELHEVYGMPAPGSGTERARAYIASWAQRRGVYVVPGGLLLIAGSPLAGQVRRRLAARVRRSTLSLAPLLTGAALGALANRRETRKLGIQIRDDLRRQAGPGERYQGGREEVRGPDASRDRGALPGGTAAGPAA
jgi:hypothetical protein